MTCTDDCMCCCDWDCACAVESGHPACTKECGCDPDAYCDEARHRRRDKED